MKPSCHTKIESNPSVSEKVLLLRKHHKVSQEVLAEIIQTRKERIVAIERGDNEYTQTQLAVIKKEFDIENLPLTAHERDIFKGRLYHWRSHIRARRLSEARQIYKETAHAANMEPYDPDMAMLHKLIETQMLSAEGDFATAEAKLDVLEGSIGRMSDECLYHYYYNCGFLYINRGQYADSLPYFLQAYDHKEGMDGFLPDDDKWLCYNIAGCYTFIDMPYLAIHFAHKIKDITDDYGIWLDNMLAQNYIYTNQLKEAKKLLDKSLIKAESIKDHETVGYIMFCNGLLYKKAEQWTEAIRYFNEALEYYPNGSDMYFFTLYHKGICTIKTRAFIDAQKLGEHAKKIYGTHKRWSIYFETLGHMVIVSSHMTSYNDESTDYIESVAISHFIKHHDYLFALECYQLLEQHYKKCRRNTRSFEMTKEILSIYMRCFANHEEVQKL